MSRLQCDSDSSDDNDSMNNPPRMKSSKRRLEADDIRAGFNRLRDEFAELYDKDYPQLQRCMEKLHNIIRTFEIDFRSAAEGARDGGLVMGIAGSAGLVAGLALAPFTFGASLAAAGAGLAAATGGGIYGGIKSSEKQQKMTQIRKDIEAELNGFQNIINPMSEKMKDINTRIEEILKDLDKLERDAIGVSGHFASSSERHNMRREDMTRLTEQMNITMRLIGTLAAIFPAVWLLLDLLGVLENDRAVNDMDKLAEIPVDEQIDESEMTSKAGKFIAGMRNVVYKLQNIMCQIKKTKQTMAILENDPKTIAGMT